MAFAVGGIVSGLDTESMVASLVSAASTPKLIMEDDLEDLEAKQEAFAGLSNRIEEFEDALEAIDTADELRALTGTTTDDTAVSVQLDGDAVMGAYEVTVNSLASNEMEVSQGYASDSTDGAFAAGTLWITYGGTATSIELAADDTSLKNVADAINEQVEGVTAYIMNTGDATNPYRLVLVGDDTGAANSIEIDTSGLDGSTGTIPTFTETETATDASVTINGITVTDDDNVIDQAIQGVSFTVKELTTSPVTVNVARDDEAIVTKIKAFVDAYNAIMSYIDQNKVFNPDEDIKGPFVGESLVRTVKSQLQMTLTSSFEGVNDISMLASMGLTASQSGDMEFDEEQFREMLESDFEGIVDFFTTDIRADEDAGIEASFLGALKDTLTMLVDEEDGLLASKDDGIQESIDTLNERIDKFDDYLASYEERLNTQFLNMELTLARLQANQQALTALMPSTDSSDDDS